MPSFPAQNADFSISWDATPAQAPQDCVMGLSNGATTDFTKMACLVRFGTTGKVEARDGGSYRADNAITYKAGTDYFFILAVRLSDHTYDVHVKMPDQSVVVVASNFKFRTEQATVGQLDNLNYVAVNGSATVANIGVPQPLGGPPGTGTTPPPIDPPIDPPPTQGGFPTKDGTGVPPGTQLTNSGSITASAGQTITAKNIEGTLTINGSNVTIENCKIDLTRFLNSNNGLVVKGGFTGIKIKNCTLIGGGINSTQNQYGINFQGSDVVVDGCNFTLWGHSMYLTGGGNITIQNCYGDGMYNQGDKPHYEHFYIGKCSDSLTIRNCTFINERTWTAALFFKTDFGPITNVTVDANHLVGGASTIYVQQAAHPISNVKVTNNAMGKGSSPGNAQYCYPGAVVQTWSGNYDHITKAPVPKS